MVKNTKLENLGKFNIEELPGERVVYPVQSPKSSKGLEISANEDFVIATNMRLIVLRKSGYEIIPYDKIEYPSVEHYGLLRKPYLVINLSGMPDKPIRINVNNNRLPSLLIQVSNILTANKDSTFAYSYGKAEAMREMSERSRVESAATSVVSSSSRAYATVEVSKSANSQEAVESNELEARAYNAAMSMKTEAKNADLEEYSKVPEVQHVPKAQSNANKISKSPVLLNTVARIAKATANAASSSFSLFNIVSEKFKYSIDGQIDNMTWAAVNSVHHYADLGQNPELFIESLAIGKVNEFISGYNAYASLGSMLTKQPPENKAAVVEGSAIGGKMSERQESKVTEAAAKQDSKAVDMRGAGSEDDTKYLRGIDSELAGMLKTSDANDAVAAQQTQQNAKKKINPDEDLLIFALPRHRSRLRLDRLVQLTKAPLNKKQKTQVQSSNL
ncbi:MAG: hypothetical protein M1125_01210 [Candidatus Marsarchaeota archaeon]|nr:hypothetical protein [Candidatus Marsarchaeota archaeon]